jgi:hypothetical protein
MKLTVKKVNAEKFTGKPKKISDGHGLYLHILKTGKFWRYSYRDVNRNPREFTIGPANMISLAEAREVHRAAWLAVRNGEDPVALRRQDRSQRIAESVEREKQGENVNQLVESWFSRKSKEWADSNSKKIKCRLDVHIPEWFRNKPVVEIKKSDVVAVLQEAEKTSVDVVHRIRGYLRDTFDLAVAKELIDVNPVRHPMVDQSVPKRSKTKRYPHIKLPHQIGETLVRIDTHEGNPSVTAYSGYTHTFSPAQGSWEACDGVKSSGKTAYGESLHIEQKSSKLI